jgi:hypothetical protein
MVTGDSSTVANSILTIKTNVRATSRKKASFYGNLILANLFLLGFAPGIFAQTSQFACIANAGVPPIVRADGLSELMGDLVLSCTGGTPTPANQAVPQYNVTVALSTNVTSRVLAGSFTEALLIVDDPASAVQPSQPLLNCGNTGAPDNGSSGSGVCSILSTGKPNLTYDGTMNGWGTAACDGSQGRPAANAYGCGRPNAFQAKLGTPSDPNQKNAVTFFSVPLDAPGSESRTLRITDLRGNSAAVGFITPGSLTTITASISISGSPELQINNPVQLVAYVEGGLTSASCGTAAGGTRVRFCEQFSTSFRPRNISFYTGDAGGTLPDATLARGQSYPAFNGSRNYPADVAQNVPGTIYNTESAFEWQNNSSNAPPTVNPPDAVGNIKVQTRVNPLKSTAAGGLDTGIANAGVAQAGTRIAFQFNSVPQDASIQVPDVLYLFHLGSSYNGDPTQYQSSASGVMVRTATDAAGAGPFTPLTGTLAGTSSLAVYEVLWADPFGTEFSELPYTILNAPPQAVIQVIMKFAPFYPSSPAGYASATLPEPRFTSCSILNCFTVTPAVGLNTSSVTSISVTADPSAGVDLTNAQMVLRASGQKDILGSTSSSAVNSLTATFNLLGVSVGDWDIVISLQGGTQFTLPRAFAVAAQCTYSFAPPAFSVAAVGGSSSFYVTPNPFACPWSASADAGWITVGQPLPQDSYWIQPFTVISNPNNSQRTGTISVFGPTITLVQDAAGQPCVYTVGPSSVTVPATGGNAVFTVDAPVGCPWTHTESIPWLQGFSGGYSDQYPPYDVFTFFVNPNTGAARSASATLAGHTVVINQSGTAAHVGVFRSGFFWLEDVDGNQQFNSPPDRAFAFGGVPGDIPITGDWNGSGTTKVGVYRPSNGLFVLDYDGDGQFTAADKAYNLGVGTQAGDVPVVGDWNGDGKTKVGLFRQGFFWILDSNGDGVFQQGVDQTFAFGGVAGDVPVVGDWNGTGTSKIGLFRQGFFWILDTNGNGSIDNVNGPGGDQAFAFGGIPGDVPVVGDWNGDGKSKVGVFRSGFFWVLDANGNYQFDGTAPGQDFAFPFGGIIGDKPVVGKW